MDGESSRGAVRQGTLAPPRLGLLVGSELGGIVRRLTGRPEIAVVDWQWQLLHGGHGVTTGGIYRIWGTARDQDGDHPWSVVLKLVRPVGNVGNDPSHHQYSRREWFVYNDPEALLPLSNDGLAAPRCYRAGEDGEGLWLWLEDIVETTERPWPLVRYGLVARHLGTFNGRFLVDRPLPRHPWLAVNVLRSYVEGYATEWTSLEKLPDSPLARRGWPSDQMERMRALWGRREALLAMEAWLPRTACHGDAIDVNLLARTTAAGVEQTVAVDWAFAGVGPLGQDLASLLRSALGPSATGYLAELDQVLFTGYLDGLGVAGWTGDPRVVRLGFTIAASLRYAINPMASFTAAITDEGSRRTLELASGLPFAVLLDGVVRLRDYCLLLADEARDLYRTLVDEAAVGGGPA